MKAIYTLLIILALPLYAQSDTGDPLRFFPHHVGDKWVYGWGGGLQTLTTEILSDSIGEDSSVYVKLIDSYFRINKNGKVYSKSKIYPDTLFGLEYDFSAPVGAIWRRFPGSQYTGRVIDRYKLNYNGSLLDAIDFGHGVSPSYDSTLWMSGFYSTYIEGIGLINKKNVETEVVELFLRGAIIDGDTIGTITSIYEGPQYLDFAFYPNPAKDYIILTTNPASSSIHSIHLFNYTFNQEIQLSNKFTELQNQKFLLDIKDIPSGFYYLHIATENSIQIFPLIITK